MKKETFAFSLSITILTGLFLLVSGASASPQKTNSSKSTLAENAKAYLKVLSATGVDCFIDDVPMECKTQSGNIELPPGKYRLKFVKAGQPPIEQTITAEAERITVVSVNNAKKWKNKKIKSRR